MMMVVVVVVATMVSNAYSQGIMQNAERDQWTFLEG